jgi:molecular chaperone GrpE
LHINYGKITTQITNIMTEKDQLEREIQDEQQEGNAEEQNIEEAAENEFDTINRYEDQIAELKDKYIRLVAEFENFRKRSARENLEIRRMAAADTISALLPVLDDFDRAKKTAESPDSGEVFTEGISLVYHKIYQIMQNMGVRKLESNGETFNPELHEAITEIPVGDDSKGKVMDTVESGYFLHDKIIRYAKVVVGK